MELKKYKLGEILDVTRGANLSGEFYATEGEYIRLTCGNFDYQNNCFKDVIMELEFSVVGILILEILC